MIEICQRQFFFLFSPFPFLARLDSLTVVYVSPAHPTPVCLGVCVAGNAGVCMPVGGQRAASGIDLHLPHCFAALGSILRTA